eukprot:CAMPEP_0198710904 /NCGR_PEP_ID=MMETSP1471-20131121/3099_1 /TAXON_ID=41880 /ORGANISM="Pycnococcus provasolii, Strain RCC733" /LENGTH=71 /DNA_ID=CAMNT_0044470627 /DNA_START=401 /DNA_END=613 /DNA_ORIENTATION=-
MNPTKTNQPPTNQQQPPTNNDTHDTYREHLLHGDGRRCTCSSSCTRRHDLFLLKEDTDTDTDTDGDGDDKG